MRLDAEGDVLEARSYDVFGKLTSQTNEVTGARVSHGYTGHEHDIEHGLMNMGGRIYDPTFARFLSADPCVQAPYPNESLNRDSYVWNNPLRYVDPSGYNTETPEGGSFPPMEIEPHDRIIGATTSASTASTDSGWDADITDTSLSMDPHPADVQQPSLLESMVPVNGSKNEADYNLDQAMNAYFDDGDNVSAVGFSLWGAPYESPYERKHRALSILVLATCLGGRVADGN